MTDTLIHVVLLITLPPLLPGVINKTKAWFAGRKGPPVLQLYYDLIKLMRKGIISQVSMECDYEEGECSICGKRVKSKNEYCPHLRKQKGGESGGKPVFEILHGVTFTGLGLLDRKGADENARIIQVASANKESITNQPEGGPAMDDKKKPDEQPAEGAKKPGNPGADQGGGGSGDPGKRIAELEQENKELKAKVAELQKRVQELESEQQAAANKSRAGKLIARRN